VNAEKRVQGRGGRAGSKSGSTKWAFGVQLGAFIVAPMVSGNWAPGRTVARKQMGPAYKSTSSSAAQLCKLSSGQLNLGKVYYFTTGPHVWLSCREGSGLKMGPQSEGEMVATNSRLVARANYRRHFYFFVALLGLLWRRRWQSSGKWRREWRLVSVERRQRSEKGDKSCPR